MNTHLHRQPEDLQALDPVLLAVERPVSMPLPVARQAGDAMRLALDTDSWRAQPATRARAEDWP